MKFEINLEDIFLDGEEPGTSVEEAIHKAVVDRLSGDMRKRLFARLDEELAKAMSAQIAVAISGKMEGIVEDIMNTTYTPVSSYGQKGEPTNFRAEIIKSVAANLTYAPKTYSSDENVFTRTVKAIVEKQTETLKKALLEQVDAKLQKDAISFAVIELQKRLGLTK